MGAEDVLELNRKGDRPAPEVPATAEVDAEAIAEDVLELGRSRTQTAEQSQEALSEALKKRKDALEESQAAVSAEVEVAAKADLEVAVTAELEAEASVELETAGSAIGFWLRLLDSLRFVIRLVAVFQHDSLRSPRDVLVFCSVFAGFDFRILLRSGWHFAPLVFLWESFFGSRFKK